MTEPVRHQAKHPNLLRGPATPGQTRGLRRGNVQHGSYGGPELAALRREHADTLARDFPSFDPRRRALLCDRLARCQLAMGWADEHGLTPKGSARLGQVHPIIAALDKWSAQADALIAQAEAVEAAAGEQERGGRLERIVAEIAASEPPAGEHDE